MGKYGVFILYHSHQAIAIPISILMKLAWQFPFPWESHGTHGTHGNSQYTVNHKNVTFYF